jgi:LCP family protein required for cell wall assembly
MKSPHFLKKLIIGLVVIILLCFGGYFLWNGSLFGKKLPEFVHKPTLAEGLLQTQPLQETTREIPLVTPMVAASPIVLSTPTPLPDNLKPVCGQKEPLIILVLGIDENEQSDVIHLVRVDFIQRRILVLSIPRDFWVPIPDMEQYNITEFKINAAYGYGEYFKGSGQGIVETSKTIFQNYGVSFDRYVVFHFSNFERMIDAVGGVDIVLDAPIGAYGYAGKTHLDGKTALDYARNRNSDNDLYRIDRQTEIIKSLFAKLILPENLLKLPGLGLEFVGDKTVISDFSIRDVSNFVCFAGELGNVSLVMRDIPKELYQPAHTNTGRFIFIPSTEVKTYIQNLIINGNY